VTCGPPDVARSVHRIACAAFPLHKTGTLTQNALTAFLVGFAKAAHVLNRLHIA
jgi:hypothetical protein